ncbi:hypothetical protein EON65_07435 [archaeon]|nr:MAG: hypothetical protein EON65_07435 [archaeon]
MSSPGSEFRAACLLSQERNRADNTERFLKYAFGAEFEDFQKERNNKQEDPFPSIPRLLNKSKNILMPCLR